MNKSRKLKLIVEKITESKLKKLKINETLDFKIKFDVQSSKFNKRDSVDVQIDRHPMPNETSDITIYINGGNPFIWKLAPEVMSFLKNKNTNFKAIEQKLESTIMKLVTDLMTDEINSAIMDVVIEKANQK